MRRALLFMLLCAACDDWSALGASYGKVPHLPAVGGYAGRDDLTLTTSTTIDTDALTISGLALPNGVRFDRWLQPDGGELAVLHVRAFTVGATVVVRLSGSLPIVIVASHDVTIDGTLDGSAHASMPGAGGAQPATGAGAGGAGSGGAQVAGHDDSGGGGAGFASAGGVGGDGGPYPGGVAGPGTGDDQLTILVGGSGGGAGSPDICPPQPGGAGGGALEIYSAGAILVSALGRIDLGGGGGGLGPACDWTGAGGGGGSGGALFLQASAVTNLGMIAANGGGGGGGGSSSPNAAGAAGQDGTLDVLPAQGGMPGDAPSMGGGGGNGGAGTLGPTAGTSTDATGGGGGGSVGRIRVVTPMFGGAASFSPAPVVSQ